MAHPPVELWLSGPEASWIVRALSDARIDVVIAEGIEEATLSEETIAIVDGAHRHLAAIRALRPGPFIVVGWDELANELSEQIKPLLFLPRPVAVGRLERRLRELLKDDADVPMQSGSRDVDGSRERQVGDPRPIETIEVERRERTVHLEDDPAYADTGGVERTVQLDEDEVESVANFTAQRSEIVTVDRAGALDAPERPGESSDAPSLQLSARLNALLHAADRRLFPGDAPLDLRFSVGEENVLELVPDELLAEGAVQVEQVALEDPLEAFTFVGTPDLLDTAAGRRNPEGTPLTVHGVRHHERSENERETNVTREGMLPPGGALRMFWEYAVRSRCQLQVEIGGGDTALISLARGKVVEFDAPIARGLADELRHEGVLRELCENDEEARQALDRAVREGRLDAFERDRRLRLRYEALIGDLCLASECRFAVSRSPSKKMASIVSAPLVVVATGQVRNRLGAGNALRWLNIDADALLWLGPEFAARAEAARLEPELIAAFEAAAGKSVGSMIEGLAATVGAAGALFSLASAGALRFEKGAKRTQSTGALRGRIEEAYALAQEADYFTLLGVARHASTREIHDAYTLRRKALVHLDLDALGLHDLEGRRREAL
ncbi:MAG: J domain-containing protein, partial [Myxococcota bacterium]